MDMREWINKRGGLAAAIVLALSAVVVIAVMQSSGNPGRPPLPTSYYFSIETGATITAAQTELPPIMDGKAVLAIVFSCGDCADKASHNIGRLERYTDEAKQTLKQAPSIGPGDAAEGARTRAMVEGLLVAEVPKPGTEILWQPKNSPAGQAIVQGMQSKCPGGASPKLCAPSAE